ncbi:MAG: BatA domain-containing protein [Bacteroidota bacterium]
MKFLYPAFLFALFTIIIPILIHLFSFRRFTTVYFSNVSYLKNIKKESRKKTRLKHLLMLLARILTIAALVFVFAQPYIPSGNQQGQGSSQIVTVYVDNSFSMNAISTRGQLLEVARNKAFEIAEAYPPGTSFRLVTNDLHPRHQHLFSKEQFIQQITDIRPSSRTVPLSVISNRIMSGFTYPPGNQGTTTYFLSDFQTRITDLQNFTSDSLFHNYLLPLSPDLTANLYIDSCWMETPAHKAGQEELLYVKIMNQSDEAYQNLPVRFYLNDTLKALGNFDIGPRGENTVELRYMNLSPGLQSGYAEISDYPVTHDNTYYLNYTVQPELKALAITSSAFREQGGLRWLRALFGGDDYVSFAEMTLENLTISRLPEYNVIIILNAYEISSGLMTELERLAQNGTTILFFPEPEGNLASYNDFLSRFNAGRIERFDTTRQRPGGIEWQHPVYSQVFRERSTDIDFPEIVGSFLFSSAVRVTETPLLWFRSGAKALSTQPAGNGNLAVFSFPLSQRNSDFARHMLFVPTLYSLVINSLPQQKLSYTTGYDSHAHLPSVPGADITSWSVMVPGSDQTFIPAVSTSEDNRLRIELNDAFDKAGHYKVLSGDEVRGAISLNYDRRESDFRFFNFSQLQSEVEKFHLKYTAAIQNQDGRFSDVFEEITRGKKLWKWFIIAALFFIIAEAAIARFWK